MSRDKIIELIGYTQGLLTLSVINLLLVLVFLAMMLRARELIRYEVCIGLTVASLIANGIFGYLLYYLYNALQTVALG